MWCSLLLSGCHASALGVKVPRQIISTKGLLLDASNLHCKKNVLRWDIQHLRFYVVQSV